MPVPKGQDSSREIWGQAPPEILENGGGLWKLFYAFS